MNARKILFPTDFSPIATQTLAYAADMAHSRNAELLIAHVVEPGAVYAFGESHLYGSAVGQGGDPNYEELKRRLAAIVPTNASVRFRHLLLQGVPAEQIVQLADRERVDLIVMATHGWTGLQHLLMGSVAEAVLRKAHCPVLSLKTGDKSTYETESLPQLTT